MNSLARCDLAAKFSDCAKRSDRRRRIETRQKKSACAVLVTVLLLREGHYRQILSRASARNPVPVSSKKNEERRPEGLRSKILRGRQMPRLESNRQNENRNPRRNCRSSSLAPVIVRKSALVMSPFGFLKCGELDKLAASARNCKFKRSVRLKVRNRLKSKLTEPGPYNLLRPTVPYPTRVTGANAEGS